MSSGALRGEIRHPGDGERLQAPSRPPAVIAIGLLVVIAVGGMLLSRVTGDGIDASIATDPALRADMETATTVGADTTTPEPVAVSDPLNLYVPGFTATLIMTTGFPSGVEVWTWSSGPEGTLTRTPVPGPLVDARPDVSGEEIAALRQQADEPPWLVVANGVGVTPVFFGAQSFAWHASQPGDIAWLSQTSTTDPPTLYIGTHADGGLYFKPIADLDEFSSLGVDRPADRIVGYDSAGFIVEHWNISDGVVVPTVERLDASGHPVMSIAGYFVGAAPDGGVVVHDLGVTRITSPGSPPTQMVPASTSAVWSPTGDRLATTSEGSPIATIEQTDAGGETSFDLRLDHLRVEAWSPDGRFLIVSGYADARPFLVFIDTLDATVWPISIEGNPIGVVAIP